MSDLIFERLLSASELSEALASALAVPSAEVEVVESAERLIERRASVRVVRSERGGQFCCRCELFSPRIAPSDTLDLARAVVRGLRARCVFGDSDPNPYRWTLFGPGGSVRQVTVSVDALDAREELVLDPPVPCAYRFLFGYETPGQASRNLAHGSDDEDSAGIWVVADAESLALDWGVQIASSAYRSVFGRALDVSSFAHWIDDIAEPDAIPPGLSSVVVGQYPVRPHEMFSPALLRDR